MKDTKKPIHLSSHAGMQLLYRGTSEKEILETIQTSEWAPSELDRLECHKNFAYNKEWNGKYYKIKQVKPIFVQEKEKIVVITVYVYYF